MARISDPQAAQPGRDQEIVEFGSPRRARSAWLLRLLVGGLVVAAAVLALRHPSRDRPPPPSSVSVTRVGHPILGISANWDLFGLSWNGLVAIQFARGQITRTVLRPTLGDSAISLVLGPHQAIVRPQDDAPGYVVPDGRPGHLLTGILSHGGQLLPGPAAGEEWFIGDNQQITLVGPAGIAGRVPIAMVTGQHLELPAASDGLGYIVILNSSGGQYDATLAGLRPVGVLLLAVGPRNWLGLTCQHGPCRTVVVDAATGARRTFPGRALNVVTGPWPTELGVVSPDGSLAAVTVASGAHGVALDLMNLATGRTTTIPAPIGTASNSRTLAWSPDSRWLFALSGSGQLVAIRATDGSVHSLGVRLPPLSQIAMRTVPAGRPG